MHGKRDSEILVYIKTILVYYQWCLYKDAKSGEKRKKGKKKEKAKKKWWSDFLNLIRKEFEKWSVVLRKKLDNKFSEHQYEHER